MSDGAGTPGAPRTGGRGWLVPVALTLATALVAVVPPAPLIFVPFALMGVGLAPRRPLGVLGGAVLGAVALVGPVDGALWRVEHGWTLILGAWFVSATVLLPAAAFLPRALAAVGGALATVALLMAPLVQGFTRLDMLVRERIRGVAVEVAGQWSQEGAGQVAGAMGQAALRAAEVQEQIYPALLALGSLTALGVAYWAWARLVLREPRPLAPFGRFAFPDGMVWVLIAALVLLVAPLEGGWERAGWNGILFMGVLYALRGAAVLRTVMPRPGIAGRILLAVMIVVLYPVAMGTALMVGLTDTWIDLRARHARAESEG